MLYNAAIILRDFAAALTGKNTLSEQRTHRLITHPPSAIMNETYLRRIRNSKGKHRHYAGTLKKRPQQYAADVFLYYTSHRKDTKYACCK